MISLQLDEQWDVAILAGNLATVGGTARVVQDVASYERVFKGEGWYDQTAGVPYLLRELTALPPAELVRERANRRALEVPGVASASTSITDFARRQLSGVIHVTTTDGEEVDIAF